MVAFVSLRKGGVYIFYKSLSLDVRALPLSTAFLFLNRFLRRIVEFNRNARQAFIPCR